MDTLPLTPDELLTMTRAVRRRLELGREVPLELVTECVRIALQAPSGSNAQQWHWVVVTDAGQRAAIGEFYRRAAEAYERSRGFAGKLHRRPVMGQVPVLLIPCIEAPALPAGNQAGLWGSLLPAVWSYMLAARARGLGTAWTTLHLAYEREVAELLGLPAHVRQGALIPTAYYTGDTFSPAARQPVEEVLHVNGW